jgi:putative membrane protein
VLIADFSGPAWLPTAPPSLANYLAPWPQPAPVLPAAAVLLATAYALGVARQVHRGRRWPVGRTAAFLSGCALLLVTTGAGIEGYGYEMFSVFMFQQLTLMMVVAPLFVLGRPGTLLLHAVPHHGLGRVTLISARRSLRSPVAGALLHPAVTIPLFLLAFYGLYLTDAATTLLGSWYGHTGMEVALLVAGVLFAVPVLSRDPLPRRQSHAGRALDVVVEMPLHAFFGVVLMMATTPLVAAFGHPPDAWGVDLLGDQETAGALAWSYGELPTLLVLLVVLSRWQREESRSVAARDRRADRDGDAELDAYNDYLTRLDERARRNR